MNNTYQYHTCTRCILDVSCDPAISFDAHGICNHCRSYDEIARQFDFSKKQKDTWIIKMVAEIKEHGKNKKYDSLLGVSGGVDSSYLALRLKEFGLNPLLVHFDNGWNSELAVKNVENIVSKLNFDLYTYVVDWEEFKDLQLAYFKAGVLDLEVPTDHGFSAALYRVARKFNIKYIISGHNITTEFILPKSMIWGKMDLANLLDIHRKFGTKKLKTFPTLSFYRSFYYQITKKFIKYQPLNYLEYNKNEAKKIISATLGWRDYGGKHGESVFTRFFQGYILPVKFNVDKRYAHLSNLICSGQISREHALAEILKPPYDAEQLKTDKAFVIKKLGMSESEFDEYMKKPIVSHLQYKSYVNGTYRYHQRFFTAIRPVINFYKLLKK